MTEHVKLFPEASQEGKHQVSNIPNYKGPTGSQMSAVSHSPDGDAEAILADLRTQYEKLRNDVADAVSKRAEQASQLAADGAEGLRSQIRSAPVASLAIAAVAGGLVAVLISQRWREPTWQEKAANYGTSLRNIDINDLTERVRRSVDGAYTSARDQASGLLPSVERLAQSLSTMDTSTLTPAIEKGRSLFRSLWNNVVPGSKD